MSKAAAVIKVLVEEVTDIHFQKGVLFVVKMDNYFTLPKAKSVLGEMGIRCLRIEGL